MLLVPVNARDLPPHPPPLERIFGVAPKAERKHGGSQNSPPIPRAGGFRKKFQQPSGVELLPIIPSAQY